jgi:perosamine synthetase
MGKDRAAPHPAPLGGRIARGHSPGTRIPVARPDLGPRERAYVEECLQTAWISSAGPFVRRFEAAFAAACGVSHGVACSSGTTALHLALTAAGVGAGDEVIVPAWTFVATANAVVHAGATPVLADVDPATWGIDPVEAARKVSRRTRAIIAVHLYGRPADIPALRRLSRRHGLLLVEDAAEAHGAEVGGRRVGSLGDVGCFSFFANKILTTGEGGILITRDGRLAKGARRLRDHGMGQRRYWHPVVGYSYGLGNLQAAIGLAQVERFDELLKRKDTIGAHYTTRLCQIPGIDLPVGQPGVRAVCWLVSILVDRRRFGMGRDALMRALAARGIETRPFFSPLHRMPPYRRAERFPVAERLAAAGMNLPSGPAITTAEIDRVVDTIREIRERGA